MEILLQNRIKKSSIIRVMLKQRNSSIELLRVIAIFLVLVVHANILHEGIGAPGLDDLQQSFVPTVMRVFFISLAYVCVDVFIIISGWFGMHASLRGLLKRVFMCFFLIMVGYVLSLSFGYSSFNLSTFVKHFLDSFFPGWFIASYMMMYILSLLVNSFVESHSELQVRNVLIAFFSLEFVYGWIFTEGGGNAFTFNSGYSALSLIGLYLLARYLRIHVFSEDENNSSKYLMEGKKWLCIWVSIVLLDVILWGVFSYYSIGQLSSRIFTYTSPMIIIQSVAMFMFFKSMHFSNRFVNWLGASSLAVLIVHGYMNCEPFLNTVCRIYDNNNGLLCLLLIFVFMCLVFIAAVLLDQIRIFCWNRIVGFIPDKRI